MNEDEKKLITKGRRWLMDYVCEEACGHMSDVSRKMLLSAVGEEFKSHMLENAEFYDAVEDFCSERRVKKEKQAFCRELLTEMVQSGQLRRRLAEKYPDAFSLSGDACGQGGE